MTQHKYDKKQLCESDKRRLGIREGAGSNALKIFQSSITCLVIS